MSKETARIKAALVELADAIESGERQDMGTIIRNILAMDQNVPRPEHRTPGLRCDCGACRAIREAQNDPDDGVN
jgi:hypothetical protein